MHLLGPEHRRLLAEAGAPYESVAGVLPDLEAFRAHVVSAALEARAERRADRGGIAPSPPSTLVLSGHAASLTPY